MGLELPDVADVVSLRLHFAPSPWRLHVMQTPLGLHFAPSPWRLHVMQTPPQAAFCTDLL